MDRSLIPPAVSSKVTPTPIKVAVQSGVEVAAIALIGAVGGPEVQWLERLGGRREDRLGLPEGEDIASLRLRDLKGVPQEYREFIEWVNDRRHTKAGRFLRVHFKTGHEAVLDPAFGWTVLDVFVLPTGDGGFGLPIEHDRKLFAMFQKEVKGRNTL
jgi:hypothetical protein